MLMMLLLVLGHHPLLSIGQTRSQECLYTWKPLEPLAEAGKAAIGLPIMAGQAAMGDVAAQQQLRALPANVVQDYMQAYGSPEQAYRTAVMTPGRFATDVSLTPSLLRVAEIAAPKLPMAMAAREFMQTDIVVLSIVIYAVLGKLADSATRALERKFLAWNPAYAKV
jgi:hypothetical protein